MKLLAVSHSCAADVNQQLYIALARAGAKVELVVPARWNDAYGRGRTPNTLAAIDFPVHFLPVWKAGHLMLHRYRGGVGALLKRAQPDIVFIDEEPGSLVAAQMGALCEKQRVPFVLYTKQNIHKKYPPPFNLIEGRIYRTASAILALSPEVQDVLRAKSFQGACPLLAHGCDLTLFHCERNHALRAELGLTLPTIGYLGRLVPEKGLQTLVEAAAILRAQKMEFQVLIVGSGPWERELRALVAQHDLENYFVWTGAVPHNRAGDYLRCMDVFVLASLTKPGWKEQFGRVLIESMACGVPVVGSNSGYIPTLIAQTGGGVVFEENNARECARAVAALLGDDQKREEMGKLGANAVRAYWTYEAIGSQLFAILKGLLPGVSSSAPTL